MTLSDRRIVYFIPCFDGPSGGIAVLMKQAKLLREHGCRVTLVYQPRVVGQAPDGLPRVKRVNTSWLGFPVDDIELVPFGKTAKAWEGDRQIDLSLSLPLDPEDIVVIPEILGGYVVDLAGFTGRKVVYAQSWLFAFQQIPIGRTWLDFGIREVLTVGEAIRDFLLAEMPGLKIGLVRYAIDRTLFRPGPVKLPVIAYQARNEYMQSKMALVIKLFHAAYPDLRHYRFERLRGLSQGEFAARLGLATAALHLDEIAGMPTLPLEAMACACLPVGWRTYGGSEYMSEDNGIWVENGNLPALAHALGQTLRERERAPDAGAQFAAGFERTLARFDEAVNRRETLAYFEALSESLP
jgi:hypothetical protein